MLSLIAANPSKDPKVKTTLIVCPLSTLDNWKTEIESKLEPELNLKFLLHYGKDRKKQWRALTKYNPIPHFLFIHFNVDMILY